MNNYKRNSGWERNAEGGPLGGGCRGDWGVYIVGGGEECMWGACGAGAVPRMGSLTPGMDSAGSETPLAKDSGGFVKKVIFHGGFVVFDFGGMAKKM